MAAADARPDGLRAAPHPVVVLIAAVDRRIVPALHFVSRVPFAAPRAVHVAVDPAESAHIAQAWMALDLSWLPLHIVEYSGRGIAASVVEHVATEFRRRPVTVVVPELTIERWWHPLLHRQTARHIAAELQHTGRITTVIVPFSVAADALPRAHLVPRR